MGIFRLIIWYGVVLIEDKTLPCDNIDEKFLITKCGHKRI